MSDEIACPICEREIPTVVYESRNHSTYRCPDCKHEWRVYHQSEFIEMDELAGEVYDYNNDNRIYLFLAGYEVIETFEGFIAYGIRGFKEHPNRRIFATEQEAWDFCEINHMDFKYDNSKYRGRVKK